MKKRHILYGIIAVAALFRLFGLSRGDTVNDEVFMSFRGLGPMDFDEAEMQTTPWEWTDPHVLDGAVDLPGAHEEIVKAQEGGIKGIPWWMHLSFHDHPLLVPLAEKISMALFGESNFGFRLPSALLGVASVYFIYVIGKKLFSENAGLSAAMIYAVTLNGVYISRTGMQESYVIFFLLICIHLLLGALEDGKYFVWLGAAFGLGLLAKYTVGIFAPIAGLYLLIVKREALKDKRLWWGIGIAALVASPIFIYNLMLYRTFGHFDFQLSFIFGQHPPVWSVMPGKEIGTLADRIRNFLPRLVATNSWLFLGLFTAGLAVCVGRLSVAARETVRRQALLFVALLMLALLVLKIGPSYRFLTMLTPFMAIVVGAAAAWFFEKDGVVRKATGIACAGILLFESFYSWNNQIRYYPSGGREAVPWLASKVRYENYNWGYNELGDYLAKELEGKMPGLSFDMEYKFLDEVRDRALKAQQERGLEPYPALIVYYGNFDKAAKLWELDRLHIYHGWPIISTAAYFEYLRKEGLDYFRRAGFQHYYFILQSNAAPFPGIEQLERGEKVPVRNPRGDEAFSVYKF